MTRKLPDGIPYEVSVKRTKRTLVRQRRLLETTPALPPQRETQSVGGVDVGINPLAVDSGGDHPNPEAHYQPVQSWQRPVAATPIPRHTTERSERSVAGSEHRLAGHRAAGAGGRRNAALTGHIAGQEGLRDNAHHHVSRTLVRKYHTIGIETLNVSGMIRAGLQSRALADAGMSGLLDKIRYKAERCGAAVVEAGQWYPSSKTCSVCGVVNGDLGREPEWDCPNCGAHHDRNENAARNLRKLALLAVGEDVMLPDGEALAGGDATAGETAPDEGRTKPETTVHPQLRLVL